MIGNVPKPVIGNVSMVIGYTTQKICTKHSRFETDPKIGKKYTI